MLINLEIQMCLTIYVNRSANILGGGNEMEIFYLAVVGTLPNYSGQVKDYYK